MIEPPALLDIKGYQDLQLIRSRGGMSYIYRGKRVETGQEVIVKLMPASKNRHEALKFQYRFNQEVLIARLSTNDHLLAATDHGDIPMRGSDDPRLYLVYPYIESGSLSDLLVFERPWETWELPHITDIVAQAAEGLFHLHKSGIVHQDVKPNNFLWKPGDMIRNPLRRIHVWLIDFGTAEPERKGKTRDIKGTLKYLAPEQMEGDVKYSVDQYALALLARLLLTGHEPPSTKEQASQLSIRPTQLNPQRLSEPEINDVLFKALARDPGERFSDVIEFAQALQAAILKQIRLNISGTFPHPSLARGQAQSADQVQVPQQMVPQQLLAEPSLQSASLTREETSSQSSIAVAAEESIVLPPLNSPRAYEPPRPRSSSQPRMTARNKTAEPALPLVFAQKWLSVKLPDALRMLAWSPDGTELVCTFYQELPQVINTRRSAETLYGFDHGHSVCWSPDSRFLAISIHDENDPQAEIRFCDRTAPKGRSRMLLFHETEPVRGMDWSYKGLFAIWLGRELQVYDLSRISTQKHLPDPLYTFSLEGDMHCDQLTTLRWSPNGEWLAAGSNDGQVVCWQPRTGRYFRQQPLKKNVRSISWSPDGRILIMAFANKQILFWDLLTGQISQAKLPESPRMVSVSAQTEQIAIATEKTLFFFEHIGALAPTGMHPGQLFAAFSPENKLATLDRYDGTELIIWQV